MELWIRSQNKKRLIKTNIIELSTHEPINLLLTEEDIGKGECNIFANEHICIGTYKSEERALEVLDEIENFIYEEVNIVNSTYEAADIEVKSKILCNMTKIFEMPKE